MKLRRILTALLLATLANVPVAAQTGSEPTSADLPSVAQIIEMHLKSLGGKAALEAIRDMTTEAIMTVDGPAGPLKMKVLSRQAGDKSLTLTTNEQFGEIRQGSDGETWWQDDPMTGPNILPADQVASLREQGGLMFPALGWDQFPGTIEVIGKREIDGKQAYEVAFNPKQGAPLTRFFDAQTGHVVQMISEVPGVGDTVKLRIVPADYRTVNGVTIPFKQTTYIPDPQSGGEVEMVLEIKDLQLNSGLDDSLFKLPPAIEKLKDK